MTRIYLDIETIPTQRPDEVARIGAGVLAHNATLKKPHSPEEVARLADEAHRKTSLGGAFGEIFCIAYAVDDAEPQCLRRGVWNMAETEADLLRSFAALLSASVADSRALPVVVGHNIVDFDRHFLRQRAVIHGVRLPHWLVEPIKPWEAQGCDTMLMWSGRPHSYIGLDDLCRALNLPGKDDGIDGSKVWDMVLAGRGEEVAAYCRGDVDRVRACFKRMMGGRNE